MKTRYRGLRVPTVVFAWCLEESRRCFVEPLHHDPREITEHIRNLLQRAGEQPQFAEYREHILNSLQRDDRWLRKRWDVALYGPKPFPPAGIKHTAVSEYVHQMSKPGWSTRWRVTRTSKGNNCYRVFYSLDDALSFRDRLLEIWDEIKDLPYGQFHNAISTRLPLQAS